MASDDDKSEKSEKSEKADKADKAEPAEKAEKADKGEVAHDEPKRDDALEGAPPAAKKKGGSKGFILLLVAAAVVTLYITARRDKAGANNAPTAPPAGWAIGQSVEIELTLVASDKKDLACSYKEAVAGKHCDFEAPKQAWSKGGGSDDKVVLRPYMTTGQQPLLAAGLWSQLPPALPADRFTVKCKYAIEGKADKPQSRWHDDNVFYPEDSERFVGSLSACSIQK